MRLEAAIAAVGPLAAPAAAPYILPAGVGPSSIGWYWAVALAVLRMAAAYEEAWPACWLAAPSLAQEEQDGRLLAVVAEEVALALPVVAAGLAAAVGCHRSR